MKSLKLPTDFGGRLTSGMAGGVAGAAAASLVTGRNFGDTLIATLPSIIGNTVGEMLGEVVAERIGGGSQGSGGGQNSPTVADNAGTAGSMTSAARETFAEIVVQARANPRLLDFGMASVFASTIALPDRVGSYESFGGALVDINQTPLGWLRDSFRSVWLDGTRSVDWLADAGHAYVRDIGLGGGEAFADSILSEAEGNDFALRLASGTLGIMASDPAYGAQWAGVKSRIDTVMAQNAARTSVIMANEGKAFALEYGKELIWTAAGGVAGRVAAPIVRPVAGKIGGWIARRGGAAESAAAAKPGTALQTYWPPNRGFQGASITEELTVGARIDRYGYEGGTFLSPQGTPDWMRSLAPGTTSKPYNIYEVTSPLQVQSGKAAPWFGQVGQGTQYELPMSVSDALAKGYLKRVGP